MIYAVYFLKVVNSAKKQENTQVRFSKNTFWFFILICDKCCLDKGTVKFLADT